MISIISDTIPNQQNVPYMAIVWNIFAAIASMNESIVFVVDSANYLCESFEVTEAIVFLILFFIRTLCYLR